MVRRHGKRPFSDILNKPVNESPNLLVVILKKNNIPIQYIFKKY